METVSEEFATMRGELQLELVEAQGQAADAEAAAAEAVATRVASEAARDAVQVAVAPLGNSIGGALANRLADKTRALQAATGAVARTAGIADAARRRVADLETSIGQIEELM